jgi:hypothetical protein
VGEIEQHRAGEHPLAATAVKTGLRGRIVQQQQKEVLGDLRHRRTVNRTLTRSRLRDPRRSCD